MTSASASPQDLGPAVAAPARQKDWVNIGFLVLTPLIGLVGTAAYTWRVGFQFWMLGLFAVLYLGVGLSITAGYHRLWSHKTYECSPLIQVFYSVFGAMAAQNSILTWSAGHRMHHKHVDDDWDPYNIRRGFWWAHILWVFYRDPVETFRDNVPDLQANPIVRWQEKWYRPLLIVVGFGVPTLIGAAFGDAIAGLLWGGFLRIVVFHHMTFLVNSAAHCFGVARYDPQVSARDSGVLALLTFGEGYHSFHHRFPADYRNGIRWYQWDPGKWFIRLLLLTGLATKLRTTSEPRIERALSEAAAAH